MNPIEQMRWAKELIYNKSRGLLELDVSSNQLILKVSRDAIVGIYLSILLNKETGNYECFFKGYTQCSGGYSDALQMQKIAKQYQTIAELLREIETAKIIVTQQELEEFITEIISAEEPIHTPAMSM